MQANPRLSVAVAIALSLCVNSSLAAPKFQELTEKSESAVRKGTDYLLKTIRRDGGCGVDINSGRSDIGCSAIVGLALMAQGNTPIEGPYSRELRKITNFILKTVDHMPAGDITTETSTQLQRKIGRHAHSFFAAVYLSQVLGEGLENRRVRGALQKLSRVISATQQPDGSWGGQSWAPMMGTVMGWISLRGAYSVGINVQGDANKTAKKLVAQMNRYNTSGWMFQLYKNATGIRVLYAMGKEDDPSTKKMVKAVLSLIKNSNKPVFTQAGGEEYLAFHLITECMLQAGGDNWKTWYPLVREGLVKYQNRDGSWTGHHCITSRTFCTAAAILVLQAPNRFLPISQE